MDIYAKVAMAAGADAGGSHVGDELALEHMLTGANQQAAAVGVQGHHAVAVVNAGSVAVAAIPSGGTTVPPSAA